jgi:hypothetical protein
MIRGHIDLVSRAKVEGWLICERVSLAGTRLLAFVGEDCVGSGMIDVFRQDLVNANLGDGIAGFSFSVYLQPSHDQRTLYIRMDGGNALLSQPDTRLVPREEIGANRRRTPRDPLSLSWMLSRGWLNQEQYDALRLLTEFGVYSQRLQLSGDERDDLAYRQHVVSVAGELFELQMYMSVIAFVRTGVRGTDLAQVRKDLHGQFPAVSPVVALWSPNGCCLSVVEGSHLYRSEESAGGVEYQFGKDHLLWLNLDCQFSVPTDCLDAHWTVFIPCRADQSTDRDYQPR